MRQLIYLIEFHIHISTQLGMVFKIAFNITYRSCTFIHYVSDLKLKGLIFVQSDSSKRKKGAFKCFNCLIKTLFIKVALECFKLSNQYIYCNKIKKRVNYSTCKIAKSPPIPLTSRKPIIKLPKVYPPDCCKEDNRNK